MDGPNRRNRAYQSNKPSTYKPTLSPSFPPILSHPAVTNPLYPLGSAVWVDTTSIPQTTYTKLRIHLLSKKLDRLIDTELDRKLDLRFDKNSKAHLFWESVDQCDPLWGLSIQPDSSTSNEFDRLRTLEQILVKNMVNQSKDLSNENVISPSSTINSIHPTSSMESSSIISHDPNLSNESNHSILVNRNSNSVPFLKQQAKCNA